MPSRLRLAVSLAALAGFTAAAAQPPPGFHPGMAPGIRLGPPPVAQPQGPPPLLFVKITGPANSRVTVYDGGQGRTFASPLAIGLLPGPRYRFAIEGLNDQDNSEALYGSIQVRDVLRLPPKMRAADHPAPFMVSKDDLEGVKAGALVSKWIVLESPSRPASVQLIPGQPSEMQNTPGDDPEETADLLGRPLAIVRLGGRDPGPQELGETPPGLVVFPDQAGVVPSMNDPRVLPIIQPPKGGEEVLKDGGDAQGPIHFDKTGTLSGVDSTDTAAEYVTYEGGKKIVVSNRVCVVAPRYTILRDVTPLNVAASLGVPSNVAVAQIGENLTLKQKDQLKRQVDEAETIKRRDRLSANILHQKVGRLVEIQPLGVTEMVWEPHVAIGRDQLIKLTLLQKARLKRQMELAVSLNRIEGVGVARTVVGTKVIGHVEELGQIVALYEPRAITFICEEEPHLPDQPLFIQKWASAEAAKPGDTLTFSISYQNVGSRPIRQIAVVDSLSSRLEYLPGTAQSDREAVFVTQENEVGSLQLRWEVKDPLPPGKHGVVKFQAKVR